MRFRLRRGVESRRRRRTLSSPELDSTLERRVVLSTVSPVVMDSATTTDSHGVTVVYDVLTPHSAPAPLTFGVFRSAAPTFDATALEVGQETVAPGTLDSGGVPADAVGHHTLTIPLAGGLTINPEHPDVLVVANPTSALASGDPKATASFRVDSIAIVTHGGIQFTRYDRTGPPWEQIMAYDLRGQGYDTVIPFNWVAESNTPGAAARQAPRLVRDVLAAAAKFSAGDVVDLQFIGHSEGTVVNDQALLRLQTEMPASIKAGWIEDTLLDPHAANTGVPGQQYSVADNILGWVAKGEIDSYQAKAKDPAVGVPAVVDQAQVFYQQTPADESHGANDDIYNLWGQVPVKGTADYYNLTADRVIHAGDSSYGMPTWYIRNVVPTLGDGGPQVAADALRGTAYGADPSLPHRPVFSGTTAPGSFVKVMVAPASDPDKLETDGRATVGADGTWSIVGRPLPNGRYRVLAESLPPRHTTPRLAVVPTDPMGTIVIEA